MGTYLILGGHSRLSRGVGRSLESLAGLGSILALPRLGNGLWASYLSALNFSLLFGERNTPYPFPEQS